MVKMDIYNPYADVESVEEEEEDTPQTDDASSRVKENINDSVNKDILKSSDITTNDQTSDISMKNEDNCTLEAIETDVKSSVSVEESAKNEFSTQSNNSNNNNEMSWASMEEQYEIFLKNTYEFFKNDLLPDGSRKPDFPLTKIDLDVRDFRIRSKLRNEFHNFAQEEIKKRPEPIMKIPDEVSVAMLESLDKKKIQSEYSSLIPSTISASVPPTDVIQTIGPKVSEGPPINTNLAIFKKPAGTPYTSSNVLAHLEFQCTPTIPNPVKHPQWELMRVISGHTGWVRCLDVDITNQWFVSGGNDRLIKIWDLATGTLKLSLTGHINTIRSVIISERHPYLFSCGEDQMIKCWDLEYNKVIRHYHGHLSGIYCMTLHPSLDILATGGRDSTVRLWDMRTKLAIHVLSGHTGTVMSLISQKHEPQIISGSLDKMIRCWDIVAGKTSVVLTHHKKAIRSLFAHPSEYTFLSGAADNLKIWKLPKGNFERNLEGVNAIINSVVIRESNDQTNSSIAIGGSDQGHLYFWDWKSGRLFQDIETIPQPGSLSSEKAIYSLCLDKSDTRLLTGECDKTIKVWRQKQEYLDDPDE